MKKLFLIRHAKSSWEEPAKTDLERPLNKRGKRDAPFMGKLLKKENFIPDLIITSPAVRALTTAKIFADETGYPEKKIVIENDIYESGIKEIEAVVQKIDSDYKTVFVFGHNPSFTSYANHVGDKFLDNVPTCGIVGIKFDIEKWKEVERGKGKVFLFEYPKKYL